MSLLAALVLAAAPAASAPAPTPPRVPTRWTVSPERAFGGGREFTGPNALWLAIDHARAGDVLDVQAGEYRWGAIGASQSAPQGTREAPILVRAFGEVRVRRQDHGGGATVAVRRGNWVTFDGFTFEGSWTGIHFHPDWDGNMAGFHFIDCEIDGLWDWKTNTSRHSGGLASKWGILAWGLKDFLWQGGSIHDVRHEHAIYVHNPLGDVTLDGVTIERVGRTALQVRCADRDSGMEGLPMGAGRLDISACTIRDTGLADGGSAITLAGRSRQEVRIANNQMEFGSDREFVRNWRARRDGRRFPGGALMVWSEREGWMNGPLRVVDNVIRVGEGAGDRPAIQIGSTPSAALSGNVISVSDLDEPGTHRRAVVLSPRRANAPQTPEHGFRDIGRITLNDNTISGNVWIEGRQQWD